MSDIFISYAKEDRPHAERLARALEGEGWSVWWDVIIPAGLTFDDVIEEALDAARCVIVIWTERSVRRRWVRTEAEEAVKRNILVPVRIEEIDPPLAFRRFQARNLIGWDGSAEATEFRRLVTDIERVLGPSPKREKQREEEEAEAPRKAEVNWLKWGAGASLMVTGVVIWVAFGSTKQPVIASTPDCDVCPEMVFIPPGEFTMGSPDTEPGHQSDEGPQRRVTVAAFAMGRYEVTRGEYQVFVQATGRAWSPPSYSQTDDHPVVNVSWEDAKAYVDWLSQISRQPYRLPSEAGVGVCRACGLNDPMALGSQRGRVLYVREWIKLVW